MSIDEKAAEEVFRKFKHVKPRLNREAIKLLCRSYEEAKSTEQPISINAGAADSSSDGNKVKSENVVNDHTPAPTQQPVSSEPHPQGIGGKPLPFWKSSSDQPVEMPHIDEAALRMAATEAMTGFVESGFIMKQNADGSLSEQYIPRNDAIAMGWQVFYAVNRFWCKHHRSTKRESNYLTLIVSEAWQFFNAEIDDAPLLRAYMRTNPTDIEGERP